LSKHTAIVVGGGAMGVGIAHALASAEYEVEVVEPNSQRRDALWPVIEGVLASGLERGVLTAADREAVLGRITLVPSLNETTQGVAVLVEAVPESLPLKQSVLREAQSRGPALLATNTSSMSIDSLAQGLNDPSALIGMHFFNPVWASRLIEIVVGERTAPETVVATERLALALGKEAIVVRDRPGFATSRLGVLLGLEAIRMVEEGVASPEAIDRAMELGYRHPMGPLRLTDLVGLDVRLAIAENLALTYGDRFEPPRLMRDMVNQGLLGRKSGRGFYEWAEGLAG